MTRVGIVGAGPVGLIMAMYLARYGVATTVYERASGPCPTPRGSTHNARTMEHYRVLGFAREVDKRGLPAGHSAGICFRDRYNGTLLADADWPNSPTDAEAWRAGLHILSRSPERMLRANQCRVEPLLFELAQAREDIDLRLEHEVVEVVETASVVTLAVEPRSGPAYRQQHDFVVGCDGARSLVRAALGAQLTGSSALPVGVLGAGSTAAHVRIKGLNGQGLDQQRRWANWVFNEDAAFNLISLDGEDDFSLLTGQFGGDAHPEQIGELITRNTLGNVEVDVVDTRRWEGGIALVADRYTSQRLFLAGDAAHLFTPHGGFGMNTGIDDAANLAWKLGAVTNGWAHPGVLDSYDVERRPVATANTLSAREHGQALAAIPRSGNGSGHRLHDYAVATMATEDIAFGADYSASPLTTTVPAGSRAPHFWRNAYARGWGDSLCERLGPGITLLHWPSERTLVNAFHTHVTSLGIPSTSCALPDISVRDTYGGDYALVRPDGHLCWVGDDLVPDTVTDALLRATGRHERGAA